MGGSRVVRRETASAPRGVSWSRCSCPPLPSALAALAVGVATGAVDVAGASLEDLERPCANCQEVQVSWAQKVAPDRAPVPPLPAVSVQGEAGDMDEAHRPGTPPMPLRRAWPLNRAWRGPEARRDAGQGPDGGQAEECVNVEWPETCVCVMVILAAGSPRPGNIRQRTTGAMGLAWMVSAAPAVGYSARPSVPRKAGSEHSETSQTHWATPSAALTAVAGAAVA